MTPYSGGEMSQMELAARNAERCVCCGAIIPEGRQVCPACDVTGPIEVIKGKVRERFENGVMTVLQDIEIKVDKARLIRALELDKKLRAGKLMEVVWCKDCKHSDDIPGGRMCRYGVCVDCVVEDDFFCRDGERKEITDDKK